ncbi:P22 phage major capsid protein family protein [Methylobacterium isbiliense]|uniref:P22 coat-protein 5 family protein n=1 Tax=Methylobacterium isbiliense TaxID=315478 RepID=A0ABQ4SF63_9HYPH|nr:P22 phage major capsid protein family protein [Methylobacterium isbiliense]MDN3622588.1 P22 phage major capsid protein family protein [Methylobacterium isbiliense]GJE00563.1 hypothetical protein GMJLKIPL_2486 [Methylobacterium isbiliense]
MANTLTGLIPTIYEGLDQVSREMIGIIPAVNRDSQVSRAAKGQQVTSFITPAVTASDIVPAVTPPNDGDQTLGSLQLTIDNAKRVPIRWNGEEQLGLNTGGPGVNRVLADQFAQGFRTLANAIEVDVVTKAVRAASRAYGTPGTAPFGTAGDFTDFSNMHMILDNNGAPMIDRQMILGSAAINNLRGKQSVLFKANEAGTDQLLRDGIIARVEGFDIHNSAGVKPIVKGTGASYVLGAGSYPVGTTWLALATGTGTVNPGDVITLAGDANKYVVVGTDISAPGTITIGSPGLRQAHAAGDAVTLSNSYTPNLAFSRSSIVLATRAPALPVVNGVPQDSALDRITVVDPVSGIAFEISTYMQYRQVQYEIALAWGAAVVKPDFVAVLQG